MCTSSTIQVETSKLSLRLISLVSYLTKMVTVGLESGGRKLFDRSMMIAHSKKIASPKKSLASLTPSPLLSDTFHNCAFELLQFLRRDYEVVVLPPTKRSDSLALYRGRDIDCSWRFVSF